MAITIDDIYDKEFALKGGGYDRDDVDQFLDEICDEMTNMQEKISSLENDLAKAQEQLRAANESVKPIAQPVPREPEIAPVAKTSATLESILLNAQQLANDAVAKAQADAEKIVNDAKEKAGQIVDDAQEEKETIEKSLTSMKASASEYRSSFLALLKKHQELLDEDSDLFQESHS